MAVQFSQGDTALLNLTATDGHGNPVNITGASITTAIKGTSGNVVIAASAHTIISGPAGTFQCQMQAADTTGCSVASGKDIVSTVTIGTSVIAYRGTGILNVLPAGPVT